MGYYHFWLLNDADERTEGLGLPCEADREAWLVADRLLAECRSVEIWNEHELIGRIGAAPLAVVDGLGFVWPAKPIKRRTRGGSQSAAKPRRRTPTARKRRTGA